MAKFKHKRTTDDCFTTPEVYEVVLDWAVRRFDIDRDKVVRPFWPGGDYEAYDYPPGSVVVDNPPFSTLSKIQAFYLDHGIPFVLFAPSLTCLSGRRYLEVDHVICDADVTYANGAVVRTAIVTSLGGDVVMETDGELGRAMTEASRRAAGRRKPNADKPKYEYPDAIATAAMFQRYASYGVDIKVRRSDCVRVGTLDAQRKIGKSIFGGGLLLSERAAAERAAAERAAAERARAPVVLELSDRERAMQAMLGGD